MNVKLHHTTKQLLKLFRKEPNHRLNRRIHGVYLAGEGLTYPEIMKITGTARRTIQKWVQRYNKNAIEGLKDKPHPRQQTKLHRELEKHFCRRLESGPSE